jgi:prepilin-type N-terminal cleavage/methylation domain-containing protein
LHQHGFAFHSEAGFHAVFVRQSIMKPALLLRVPFPEFRVPSSTFRVSGGFTLIEITIAITIASLALVGLLGMVPQGIRTMKMATDMAIETRIHQQIISELTQTDWDKRYTYNEAVRFFDDQGIPVTEAQNRADDSLYPIVYSLRILVPREGESLPSILAKPGGQRAKFRPFDNSNLVRTVGSSTSSSSTGGHDGVQLVLLEICTSGLARNSSDFEKQSNERSIHVYRSTLTRATKL